MARFRVLDQHMIRIVRLRGPERTWVRSYSDMFAAFCIPFEILVGIVYISDFQVL
jgi:hypothetical protein